MRTGRTLMRQLELQRGAGEALTAEVRPKDQVWNTREWRSDQMAGQCHGTPIRTMAQMTKFQPAIRLPNWWDHRRSGLISLKIPVFCGARRESSAATSKNPPNCSNT